MINSSKGQSIIHNILINKILIESDGPFTRIESKKYYPTKLQNVYNQLGELLSCDKIENIIWNNFNSLLSMN